MAVTIWINEFHYDNDGSDTGEFIEIAGPAGTDLTGWSIVLYNGAVGTAYSTTSLTGATLTNVVNGVGFWTVPYPVNGIQNGAPDGIALVDDTGTVVEFLSYEGTMVATDGPAAGLSSTDIGVSEPSATPAGFSLQRTGEGRTAADFTTWAAPAAQTQTAANTGQTITSEGTGGDGDGDGDGGDGDGGDGDGGDGVDETAIYEIQGDGLVSDLVGDSVVTSGIVTAVDSNGFYLQDKTGDGNDATSDAIFVFTSSRPTVTAGDEIRISGTVGEFTPGGASTGNQSTTQLSSITNITLLSQGNALPEAVRIGEGGRAIPTGSIDDDPTTSDATADGLDFFESLEGMRVSVDNLRVTGATNQFGEVFGVSGPATGLSERGTLNISPDDFNPERVQFNFDNGILAGPAPLLDAGDSIANVTGVLSYAFGNYEILPTQALGAITDGGLTAETTSIAASATQLTIASYNVLNLDPNDGDGDTDVADGRFDAIARHIVQNMGTPDILGLQEVQDNSGSTNDGTVSASQTLQLLIDAIDRLDDGLVNGTSGYAYIDNTFIANNSSGGQPGGNIRTAFLYNTERVDLVEGSVRSVGSQAPGGTFEGARLPLIADFAFNGQTVTVINNHFSSKGGSAPILGTTQPFEERQDDPSVNGSLDERLAQASTVALAVEELLAADAKAKIAVVGDFNEFEFVSPLKILEDAGLTNLTNTLPEDERYSFVFQGNSQSLDHILVSDALAGGAQFDAVHVNSEFAVTPQRASDHDPLVAGVTIAPPEPETETVAVAFNEVRKFLFFKRTVADITVGDESARERLGPLSSEERLDFADVTLRTEGPGFDFLVATRGTVGISSRRERLSERAEINDDEFLFIDLGGDAERIALDFAGREAMVELAFFDDGRLVAEDTFALSGTGGFEYDTGVLFDEVRISDGGRAGLRLEGFDFDRLIEEDAFVLAAAAQGGSDYGSL